MGGLHANLTPEEAHGLLQWWLEAGVDTLVEEQPRDWFKPVEAAVSKPNAAATGEATVASPALPDFASLDALKAWLATAPEVPLAKGIGRRALPHGLGEAPVMLMVDAPDADSVADGRPLTGGQRELAAKMLAAIGVRSDDAYVASLICVHAPGRKLSETERETCVALARAHVRLAAPRLLLLMGDAPARALTGKPLAEARGKVHNVEGVRTVATFHPRHLINRPGDKRLAWADLLLLTETIEQ